jgi:hypothetical protein
VKWTANHHNFHVTFIDLYNYPEFADWLLEQKIGEKTPYEALFKLKPQVDKARSFGSVA